MWFPNVNVYNLLIQLPLEHMALNCMGPLTCRFFDRYSIVL